MNAQWRLISITLALLSAGVVSADYPEAIRKTSGLVAYYRFEDDHASIADHASGKYEAKEQGDVVRQVESAFPTLGKAARLNAGGHVRLPKLGKHEAVTVELWLKLLKPPKEIAAIYAADAWQQEFLHFNLLPTGAIEIAVHGANQYSHSPPETVPVGKWVHLAMTYDRDSGEIFLYANGRLASEAVTTSRPPIDLVEGSLGVWMNGTPSRPLEAEIDEVAIYSVALKAPQIRQHYSAAKGVVTKPVDFASEVRPIFAKHCLDCHGAETKESELRLDVRDSVLRGGESGEPAIMPYGADESHIVQLVSSSDEKHRMPPQGDRLTANEIATLKNWIDQGAPWPDEFAGQAEIEKVTTNHWSFQPVTKHTPPASEDPFVSQGNAIDAFVLARLIEKELTPSTTADRRTLIRRLYFDLHGLPPSPEEVAAFANDPSPKAWEALVDRALASPRYGERWASHWLDVIRYGDTHGFEVNTPREHAWPYRDWVIQSLNNDKPYDQFIIEQLAGDQLGADAATGFLVAAPALLPGQVGRDEPSMRQARSDELHEIIVSVGSGVLGLTIGCARCHNHKFDPVSQRDYYQLQAIFSGVRYGDRPLKNPADVRLNENLPPPLAVFGGNFSSAMPTHRLYRGDPMQRRERVTPNVPAVLGSLGLETAASEAERRMALAKWLVQPTNPLTARVIVNRIWQHHFGTGLANTPSDFGAMGVKPTHPELLDWLAATLVENKWSLKSLHRTMLLSSTYRQSSRPNEKGLAVDANNGLLWRYSPRRLDMEPIRDSILATSGALDLTMGGPGFMVFKPNTNYVRVYDAKEEWGPGDWRRMVYAHRVRMAQDGVFGAFDCPDAGQPQPKRSRSTTAIQALNLLNSSFMKQQSDLLAARVKREAGEELPKQLTRLLALAYNRTPTETELAAMAEVAQAHGLPAVCRAVLNSNEFLWVE